MTPKSQANKPINPGIPIVVEWAVVSADIKPERLA